MSAGSSYSCDATESVAKETRDKQEKTQVELLPLGYDFNVYASITEKDGTAGTFRLTFRNKGKIGTALNVYSYVKADANRGAWFYALEKPGKDGVPVTLADDYDLGSRAGKYEFAVHGPSGYLSEFRGDANNAGQKLIADIVNVAASTDGTGVVRFDFGEWPGANGDLTMINAYTTETATIAAKTASIASATKDGWYDVAFIDKAGTGYLRRYAGHVENGQIGKSDPAIGMQYDAKRRTYVGVTA